MIQGPIKLIINYLQLQNIMTESYILSVMLYFSDQYLHHQFRSYWGYKELDFQVICGCLKILAIHSAVFLRKIDADLENECHIFFSGSLLVNELY